MNELCKKFSNDLDKFDWFYTCEFIENNLVVFVNEMNAEILNLIPLEVEGVKVKVWFAEYYLAEEKYGNQHFENNSELN
jgi:hypothetical protein